jgi:hypothetical protein
MRQERSDAAVNMSKSPKKKDNSLINLKCVHSFEAINFVLICEFWNYECFLKLWLNSTYI